VQQNQPLNEIENEIAQHMLNVKPTSSKTLQKYILSLMPLVKRVITEQLVAIDGWTAGSVHNVTLFALYVNNVGIQKEYLLALAPLINEEELGHNNMLNLLKQHWH
jgi:hypothetical protein